jgi:hypothetical protein
MTTATLPQPVALELTRCDAACPAAGQTRWTLRHHKGELVLCGHHSRLHGPALIASGSIGKQLSRPPGGS